MRSTSIFILLLLLISCGSSDRHFPIPASCEQIVLVRSSDWDTHQGTLETFEKFSHQTWKRIHGPFPVVVGKNGMGWGLGLHIKEDIDGPEKKEGDGKSPAGIYRLGFAFGYAPTPILKNLNIEYRPMTSAMLCIDDAGSTHYNRIVDKKAITSLDWETFEHMKRDDDLYRHGIVVEHNPLKTPGKGSCIFLHLWRDAQHGTAGCTAMPAERIEELLLWLSDKKYPLLVQLPEDVYDEVRDSWALP